MVEKSNTSSDFMARMLDLQQQYLNNLGQLFQAQPGGAGQSPFESWWDQFPSSGQSGFDDFFRQLARTSMDIMQTPSADLASMLQSGQLPPDWYERLHTQFNDWLSNVGNNPVFERMNAQLRQSLLQPLGIDMNPGVFNPAAVMDSSILKLLQNLVDGEEKAAGQRLLKTLEAYQQQVMQMNHMIAQVGIDSIQTLQSQFESGSDTDIKQLYESWMEISNKIFNELKLDERYRQLSASMRKIEAQLKADIDQYRRALINQLGLVSQQEHEALRRELDELKAQVRQMAARKPASTTPPPAQAEPEAAPQADDSEDPPADDFTILKGIGSKFNEKLHQQGINSLSQLASMSDDMLKALDDTLNTNGRPFQQQWREQAEQILKNLSGKQ